MVSKHLQRYIDNFITMDIIATSKDGSVMFYFTYCTQQKRKTIPLLNKGEHLL